MRAIGIAPGTRAVLMVPPGTGLLPAGLRRVQGGHRPRAHRPGDRPRATWASAAARPPPRSSSASRRRSWPVASSAGAARPCGDGSSWRRGTTWFPGAIPLDVVRRAGERLRESGQGDGLIAGTVPRDEPAAILFTSGSTGPPKGAVYTHGILNAQVDIIRDLFDIEPGEIDLCTFPLFALFAPALGMTSIVPEMDPTRPARANPGPDRRADRRLRRDQLVRLARPAPAARPGRCRPVQAADPEARRLRRCAGPGEDHRADGGPARAARAGPHGLRRDRGPAGRLDRQRRDPGRDPARRPTRAGASASAARSRGSRSGSSASRDDPIPDWSDDLAGPRRHDRRDRRLGAGRHPRVLQPPRGDATRQDRRPGPVAHLSTAWGTSAISTIAAGSGSAGGSRTGSILPDETLFTIPCEAIFNTHPDVFRSALVGVNRDGGDDPGDLHRAGPATVSRARRSGSAASCSSAGRIRPHPADPHDPVPSGVPRGYPPQLQDLPREARRLGRQEAFVNGTTTDLGRVLVTGGGGFLGTADRPAAARSRPGGPQPVPERLSASSGAGRRASPGRHRRSRASSLAPSRDAARSSTPRPRPASGGRSASITARTCRGRGT